MASLGVTKASPFHPVNTMAIDGQAMAADRELAGFLLILSGNAFRHHIEAETKWHTTF